MFKAIKKIFFIFCLLIAVFTVAHFALALDVGLDQAAGTGLSVVDPRVMAANIIRIALGFLGIIAVCLIIYAGFLWMTAGGEAEKVEKAKKILTEAVIGLIIILSAFAIASFILNSLIGATTNPNPNPNVCDLPCASGQNCCYGVCTSDPCVPHPDPNYSLTASIYPSGEWSVPLNGSGGVRFNDQIEPGVGDFTVNTVDAPNSLPAAESDITNQIGTTTSNNKIDYQPIATCDEVKAAFPAAGIIIPDGYGDNKCFRPDMIKDDLYVGGSGYRVQVDNYKTIGGTSLICPISGCVTDFSASPTLDVTPPTISFDYRTMCVNTNNTLAAWVNDDWGVKEVGFYVDNRSHTPSSTSTPSTLTRNYHAEISSTLITTPGNHTIKVVALDIADNYATAEKVVTAWPSHCCNGTKDIDETEVDCGGSCAACDGSRCDKVSAPTTPTTCDNDICASQFCTKENSNKLSCEAAGYALNTESCCICRRQPVITGIFPVGGFCVNKIHEACLADSDCPSSTCDKTKPNGVAGNFLTIVGKNFGATLGTVYASSTNGWIKAELANNEGAGGNILCGNDVWSDEQIIAIVPVGPVNGPIKVVTGAGFSDDSTANPEIENFVLNSIARPGICQIENVKCAGQSDVVCKKDHGLLNDTINYYGIKLLGVSSYLGSLDNKISGVKEGDFNDKDGKAKVPNIVAGKTSTFVLKADGKVYSNYLNFYKDEELYKGPFISSFDPKEGATGQYVTIHGGGFGNTRGLVYFGGVNGTPASFDFPKICADSIWSDKQVIVKVPPIVAAGPGFINGHYKITMKIGTWPAIDTTTIRPSVDFEASSTLPLKPSLCKIDPIIGKTNSPVNLYGEYFGAKAIPPTPYVKIDGKPYPLIRFQVNKDQAEGKIGFWDKEGDADMATTTVPDQAVTGPVKIVQTKTVQNNLQELIGNGLNFTVGICKTADDCGVNSLCCSVGTPYASQCKKFDTGKTTEQDLCFPEIKSCVYEWKFDTKNILPRVGDPCDKDTTTPKCDKNDAVCQPSGLVCDPTSCVCKQPCNNNLTDVSCSPNVNKCLTTPTTPVCNTNTCLCEECATATDCKDGEVCSPTHTCVPAVESCSGYGNQCASAGFCPNSYGQCSVHPAGELVSCACDEAFPSLCKDGGCQYNSKLERCVSLSGSGMTTTACNQPKTVIGVDGKSLKAQCVDYKWQIDAVSSSCPPGYTNKGAGKCVGDYCTSCGNGFKCLAGGQGSGTETLCAVDKEVCPVGSTCDSNKKCTNSGSAAGCECCCRKANSNQDCCAPLKCEGACGSDTGNLNPATFGLCTGCTVIVKNIDGTTNQLASQTTSNNVCNCPGSSGKFCDTSVAKGVCRDCAQLSDAQSCSGLGAGTCCVDAKNSNACRINTAYDASKNPIYATDDANPTYNYCAYYSCGIVGNVNQCSTTPKNTGNYRTANCDGKCLQGEGEACYDGGKPGACVEASSRCDTAKNLICDIPSCTCKSAVPQFGQNCVSYTSVQPSCDATKCNNFSCLTDLGASPLTPPCGICCCDPSPGNDKCATSLNPKLKCQANRGTCSGAGRGLCCGCSKDSECGGTDSSIGCGSDACCQARPSVISPTTPINGATKVCRNTSISATFSQLMQINTFVGNVIVAGEYGTDQCPAGTEYLAAVYKPTVFARIKSWLAGLPVINKLLTADFVVEAQAESTPSSSPLSSPSSSPLPQPLSKNYCAVAGSASGYNKGTQTVLEFKLQKLLDPGRKYYVIIKGDSDINDAINNGVLSQAGIGMNPVGRDSVFNGVAYKGKIWSFTTMATQENNGACAIDQVEIDPASYLFQTNIDNISDNTAGDKFNTIDDSDLVYRAIARAVNGSILSPVDVYSWTWDWLSGTTQVFNFFPPTAGSLAYNEKLLRASKDFKEGNSVITAQVHFSAPANSLGLTATANAYLMVCANPWPKVDPNNHTWSPWQEKEKNCTTQTEVCDNTNYEISYCRDAGGPGTADDLPAIFSDSAVIRGQSTNLKCSDNKGSCVNSAIGDACSNESKLKCSDGSSANCANKDIICGSGKCVYDISCQIDILKELYFFREGLPATSGGFTVTPLAKGGAVSVNWSNVVSPDDESPVTGYKIYYGTASGAYPYSVATSTFGTVASPQIITGLTNGRAYYFALTSYNAQKAESAKSIEVSVTPRDTLGPEPAPSQLVATSTDRRIELGWKNNYKEVVSYRAFYKANDTNYNCDGSVSFGSSVPAKNNTATVSGLANGVKYCFGLVAYDSYGNPSATTTTLNSIIIPFAPPTNLSLTGVADKIVKLSWGAAQGATGYKVYYGTAHGVYGSPPDDVKNVTSYNKTGLTGGTTYYFAVTSYNANNTNKVESVKSNEISAKPLALAVPQGLWSTADATGITLKWTANTDDATKYKVYYGTASGNYTSSIDVGNVTSKKITGLSNSQTYYFTVAALDAQGNESMKAIEFSFNMGTITNEANCKANLQQIRNAIIAKRIETNKYLTEIADPKCSACACNNPDPESLNSITSIGCRDKMIATFTALGFSGLLVDPWSHPYFIDENQGENTSPDYIYSSTPPGCGYTAVDLFTKHL